MFAAAFCAMLELLKGQEGTPCLKCDTPKIKGGRFPVKQLISRRSFLKAAGVTAAAASMAIGAPAASACWLGDKSDVTILYTNDVDYQLARLLAARVITEEPFCQITQEHLREAIQVMENCKKVICADVPIGECNKGLEELIRAAKKRM